MVQESEVHESEYLVHGIVKGGNLANSARSPWPRMRICLAAGLFAHSVVAQFGTIHIDWVSEGALGDGRATPRVGGLSAGSEGEEPAPLPAPSADTYEEAWWRDDFAHDPPSVWFGAATTQRGKRPASMAARQASNTRPPWRPALAHRLIGRG